MIGDSFNALQAALSAWDGRRRQQELLWRLPLGLAAGLSVALVAALLSRARPLLLRDELAVLAMVAALAGLIITALVVLLRRRLLPAQARFADRHFGLRERMTTAVEIQTGLLPADDAMATRQLSDALAATKTVEAHRLLPLRLRPPDWLPALAVGLLLALALASPNPQEAILREQRAVAEVIEQQAEALDELAAGIAADETLNEEQREALLQPLEEALAALNESGLSREEAVAAISQAEAELRALSRELDPTSLNEALAKAAAPLSNHSLAGEFTTALQAGQPGRAGAAAADLAGSLSDLDAEAATTLADQLAEAATSLATADAELAQTLDRTAEALAEGDTAAAQAALDEAAALLNERSQAATTAAQASGAADQLESARSEVAQSGASGPVTSGGDEAGAPSDSGAAPGSANGGAQPGDNAGGVGPGGGHVESVFVPRPADLEGQGEAVELDVQCLSDPASCGPVGGQSPATLPDQGGSLVPYDQVFGEYRDTAFEALDRSNIPAGLQGVIRDYFSALEP